MTSYSNEKAFLAEDGVTVLRRVGGTGHGGIVFDGYEEFHPGDPGYDELLAVAQRPRPPAAKPSARPVDPRTLAILLRATGLSEKDLE